MVPSPTPDQPRRGLVATLGVAALITLAAGIVSLFVVGGGDTAAGPTTSAATTRATTATTRATTSSATTTTRSITATTTSSTTTSTTRSSATTATSFPEPAVAAPSEEPAPADEPSGGGGGGGGTATTSPPSGTTTTTSGPGPTTTTGAQDPYVQQWRWKDEDDPARRNDGFNNLPVLQWTVTPGVQVEVLDPDQQVLSRANAGELAVCPGTVTTQSGQPPTCRTDVQQETTYTYTLRVIENGQEVRKLFLRLIVTP